jgi:hypothetical protein
LTFLSPFEPTAPRESFGEERNVEAEFPTRLIHGLLFVGQEVKEHDPDGVRQKYLRNVTIAWTVAAASAPMRK